MFTSFLLHDVELAANQNKSILNRAQHILRLQSENETCHSCIVHIHEHTRIQTGASYLACGDTWSMMVLMMRGTNSDTTL